MQLFMKPVEGGSSNTFGFISHISKIAMLCCYHETDKTNKKEKDEMNEKTDEER